MMTSLKELPSLVARIGLVKACFVTNPYNARDDVQRLTKEFFLTWMK